MVILGTVLEVFCRKGIPVTIDPWVTISTNDQALSGLQLKDIFEHRPRCRRGQKAQIIRYRTLVHLGDDRRVLKNRFDLRGKDKTAMGDGIVEWFDAQPVAV